jgi:hypothetical protein
MPAYANEGDIICVFLGARVPFVVRPNPVGENETQTYSLVGECYPHGMMHGGGLALGDVEEIILV